MTSPITVALDDDASVHRPNRKGLPSWQWKRSGGSQLFAADGTEFFRIDPLSRPEVERLLELGELDAVQIQCGGGVERWVGPAEARRLWTQIEPDLDDVESWRPASGSPGAIPYRAELWRALSGRYVLVFTNE